MKARDKNAGPMKKRRVKKRRVIVGRISDLRASTAKAAAGRKALTGPPPKMVVIFATGKAAEMNLKHPRAGLFTDMINQARVASLPLYVEVDPRTKTVVDVQVAIEGTVTSINLDTAGNAEIEVQISHAIHVLRKANPDFKRLLAVARKAMDNGDRVLVTERDAKGIIDIRSAETRPGDEPPRVMEAPPFDQTSRAPALETAAAAVTPARAKQLFDMCKAKSCNPRTVPPPCIPFLYPDDGCWGRASEMCRLMIGSGAQPAKVWIYGRLQARTRNNPTCMVRWGWHVTATLQVQIGSAVETQAIDPSLFDTPINVPTWKSVQGDAGAALAATAADVFYRDKGGNVQYDPTYAQTNQVLATYRLRLQQRSASSAGPPPYKSCP